MNEDTPAPAIEGTGDDQAHAVGTAIAAQNLAVESMRQRVDMLEQQLADLRETVEKAVNMQNDLAAGAAIARENASATDAAAIRLGEQRRESEEAMNRRNRLQTGL